MIDEWCDCYDLKKNRFMIGQLVWFFLDNDINTLYLGTVQAEITTKNNYGTIIRYAMRTNSKVVERNDTPIAIPDMIFRCLDDAAIFLAEKKKSNDEIYEKIRNEIK